MDYRILSLAEAARIAGASEDELRCAIKDGFLSAQFQQNTGEFHIRHNDLTTYIQTARKGSALDSQPRRRRVLIIDDEINWGNLMKMELERDPRIEAKFATWGKDGVVMAERFQPDLCLIDFMLPDIQGDHVLEALRSRKSLAKTKMVVYSAHTKDAVLQNPKLQQRLTDLGAEEFISKTIGMRQILIHVYNFLGLDTQTKILRKIQ